MSRCVRGASDGLAVQERERADEAAMAEARPGTVAVESMEPSRVVRVTQGQIHLLIPPLQDT